LADGLRHLGWDVLPGVANFLLARLPDASCSAATLVQLAQAQGLFIRDAVRMGASLGPRVVRIAVKDAATNRQMLDLLRRLQPTQ
jgi:histidinol-phosphate/aromatic aminotransferase/cobyric acid decarboxylase-like protein